jgi:hypothetical protein
MKRIVIACALALAACGQGGEQQQTTFPVVDSPNYDASIGPNGAAGITTALPMNVEAVRAAAPNYIVSEVQDQVEGDPFTAITLSAGDEEVFRILPSPDRTHIHAIVTRSSQARGPTADIVGAVKFAVAPPEEVPFCIAQYVDGAPGFACSTAADGTFWRVYRLPEGAEGAATFEEIEPDVLHDATLAEMRWFAPRAP